MSTWGNSLLGRRDLVPMTVDYEKISTPYPMVRLSHRALGPYYAGPVFVWDIDKTYLDTRFSQLKHLLRIPFEFGIDKRAIAGTRELLHGIRQGPGGREHFPLYFVSASPPQLRKAIEKKMLLDGIEFDGITYKNPLEVLKRGQFDQLKEQVVFKLSALVLMYADLPDGAEYHLFGDDVERDALIYCLFGDLAAGRLRGDRLAATLESLGARREYAVALAEAAEGLPMREAVQGCYIHLTRCPEGESIADFGPAVTGWPTAAAAAGHLASLGLLADEGAEKVKRASPASNPIPGPAAGNAEGFLTPAHLLAAAD